MAGLRRSGSLPVTAIEKLAAARAVLISAASRSSTLLGLLLIYSRTKRQTKLRPLPLLIMDVIRGTVKMGVGILIFGVDCGKIVGGVVRIGQKRFAGRWTRGEGVE